MRITVAGRVGVQRAGSTEQSLPGGQVRLAFAVLVLERTRAVSRHELADRLWPDSLPPTWDAALRNIVTRLRQALAATSLGTDAVVSTGDGYACRLPPDAVVDIEEAQAEVAAGLRLLGLGQPAAAAARLSRATETLGLPVLPGLEGDWADGIREACAAVQTQGLEALADALLADQQPGPAVTAAEAALVVGPFRETAHRLLMRAHAATGNRAEALRAYSRCRQLLVDELGVGPSPDTERDYLELLLLGDGDGTAPGPVAAAGDDNGDAQLAASRDELFGRDAELAEVADAIARGRVATISGPGGVGKTRLAAAYADAAAEHFAGRVRWVELVSVDESGVAAAIASVVSGERVGVEPLDAAIAALRGEPSLLVLDNCEHVIDEVADVTGALIHGARPLRVLATSRVPLGVGGERVIRLPPLAVPTDADDHGAALDSPSVALFGRRAAEVRRDFELTPELTPTVVEICRRLDGLPLAIELAASLVRLMPVADIAGRLDDRFRLLRSARRDVDLRHHSLGDVIAWSYDLLDDGERDLFEHVAAFPGSFSLAGARAVVGGAGDELDALRQLTGLVDQSMLVAVGDDEARYVLLESMREFGRARLEASERADAARERVVVFEVGLAEAARAGMRSAEEALWVARIDAELPNLVAAFRWAADAGAVDRCLRIVVSLFDYAFHRVRPEIGVLASEAVALRGAADHPLFAEALAVAGYLEWQRGLGREADEHITRSLHIAESWLNLDALGTISLFHGDIDGAIAAYARAAGAVADEDSYLLAITRSQQAFAAVYGGRVDAAELAALAEAAAIDSGNPTALAQASWGTGVVFMESDPEFALMRFERCIALAAGVRNRLAHGAASVPAQEMRTRLERRSAHDDVRAALAELRYMHSIDNAATQGVLLRRLVWGLTELGLLEDAAMVAGAEATVSLTLPMRTREQHRHETVLAVLAGRLGAETWPRLQARGAALSADDVVALLRRVEAAVDARDDT